MNKSTISQNIARLRREKQSKQEELANYVGVSTQAVSKWENGGMPDTDLLPRIADYFGVTIDALFGRTNSESNHLWHYLVKTLSDDDELKRAFGVCERLIQAMQTDDASSEPEEIKLENGLTSQLISVQRNSGFAKIVISDSLPYFFLIPDYSDMKAELFDMASLPALFTDLGDENFFKAITYLMLRESNKAFTPNLLTKKLSFSEIETSTVIEKLLRYRLLSSTKVEIDDEEITMYKTEMSQSFCAMIRFARELPQPAMKNENGSFQEKNQETRVIHN